MDIALGVIPLAIKFVGYGIQIYQLFEASKVVGRDFSQLETEFKLEMEFLRSWARERGLDNQRSAKLNPQEEKYVLALQVLAIIATILADANPLRSKYRGSTSLHPVPPRGRLREWASRLRAPSKSPNRPPSPGNNQYLHELDKLGLRENSSINEQLGILREFASDIQKDLSLASKLRWGFSNKDKLQDLVTQLKRWNDHLKRLDLPLIGITSARPEYKVKFNPRHCRNPHFCGRKDVFKKVGQSFWPNAPSPLPSSHPLDRKVIALHGLGGIGKSQIALEYAFRYEEQYSSIFWVNADNSTEMEKSALEVLEKIIDRYAALSEFSTYQKIANALEVYDNIDTRKKLIDAIAPSASKFLKQWLSREGNDHWLLLIDNYDDPDSLDLNELLPGGNFGHMIITTRKKEVAGKYEAIYVAEFGEEVGVELLKKSSKKHQLSETENRHAIKIIELVGGLPLALDQAGAYVFTVEGSFAEYEKLLRTKYAEHMFEDKNPKGNTVFATTSHTTNTVWRLSFDALPQDAAKLLMLCSFIGNRGIQREMLYRGREEVNWMKSEQTIDEALKNLFSLSLIKREVSETPGDYGIWIHPVVHKWVRSHVARMQRPQSRGGGVDRKQVKDTDTKGAHGLEKEYSELALYLVTSTFVLDGPRSSEEWTYELSIVPHIKCCFKTFRSHTIAENEPQYIKVQAALYSLARMYTRLGYVDEAHDAYAKVFSGPKKKSVDPDDLKMMDHFGKNLFLQAKYTEALEWYRRALAGKEKTLGKDDLSTLDTRHHIAKVFLEEGEYKEALQEYEKVLEVQEKKLGKSDPLTLETRQSMAVVHKDLGNYTEALSLLKEVRSEKKKKIADGTMGVNDPSILDTIHVMALVFETQGKYKEAQRKYERVFKGQEESLGKNHYSTLDTAHSLAGLYGTQELYEEALSLYERVLRGIEDIFGRDHPWTLMTINGIADIHDIQGRYDEALGEYQEVYDGFHKHQMGGARGEYTYMAANDIGRVMNRKGRYAKALEWYRIAEEGQERELGKDHATTLSSKFGIAYSLENQGKYDQALVIYEQVREGISNALSPDHNMKWMATCEIASVLNNQGQYRDALEHYRQAEEGQKKAVGENHKSTLEAVHGTANVLDNLARYDEAMALYKRTCDGLSKKLGKEHPLTLLVACGIGAVFEHKKEFDAALERYEYAKDGLGKTLGEDHPWTLLALHGMGNVSANKGEYGVALDYYQRVRDGRLNVLGDEHPFTFQAISSIASVFKQQRRYPEAFDHYQQALEGLERVVGPGHPLTLTAVHGKASILEKQGKYAEALALYRRAREGREKLLGKKHPETILSEGKESRMKRRSFFDTVYRAVVPKACWAPRK